MSDDLVKRGRLLACPDQYQQDVVDEMADRIEELEAADARAAKYVEAVICARTRFTGEWPYVGWKGLGLALREALDERDILREQHAELHDLVRDIDKVVLFEGVPGGTELQARIDLALGYGTLDEQEPAR